MIRRWLPWALLWCIAVLIAWFFLAAALFLIAVVTVLLVGVLSARRYRERQHTKETEASDDWITLGESWTGTPFRLKRSLIQRNHLCLVGESGTGKSVTAAHILAQCVAAGQPVIVVDPKDDRYLARALYAAVQEAGGEMTMMDCRPTAPVQINPFRGLSVPVLRQCFISAWGIQDGAHAAVNYYRAQDREAAELAADLIVKESLTFPGFLAQAARIKTIYKSDHFWRLCRDIGTMPVVQATEGFEWSRALQPGHLLYIVSSTEDDKVQILTKFIMQRLVQALRERPIDLPDVPYATIFIDELRYMLSEVMLNSLSTIRDRQVHLLLAFQDINNLLENPLLNPYAVQSIVTANTGIKCVFRIQHVDTADLFVKMSRSRAVLKKSYHRGVTGTSCSLTEHTVPEVTREQLMRLPKPAFDGDWCHGYAFFDGQEQAFRNRPLPLSTEMPPVCVAQPSAEGICHIHQLI